MTLAEALAKAEADIARMNLMVNVLDEAIEEKTLSVIDREEDSTEWL